MMKQSSDNLLIASGVLLGMGFAGFFDGIVLHQILQWHHMLSSVRPTTSVADLEANTLWDGIFLAGASVLTGIGLFLLWRTHRSDGSKSSRRLIGALLIGVGGFNLVEGIIDHQILGIHHVKSGPNQLLWDLGFLVISAVLLLIGSIVMRSQQQDTASTI